VSTLARSALLFVVAGLMEIGGGYLMWLWLRERWAWWVGAIGAIVLVGYGVVPTLQPANFGRVYAAYGGVFIRDVDAVGLVGGRSAPGPLGRDRRRGLPRRGGAHHVRTPQRRPVTSVANGQS
jgi:drug/metabolite transporter superfamily protein YnfA